MLGRRVVGRRGGEKVERWSSGGGFMVLPRRSFNGDWWFRTLIAGDTSHFRFVLRCGTAAQGVWTVVLYIHGPESYTAATVRAWAIDSPRLPSPHHRPPLVRSNHVVSHADGIPRFGAVLPISMKFYTLLPCWKLQIWLITIFRLDFNVSSCFIFQVFVPV